MKKYTVGEKRIGPRFDGGRSPLSTPLPKLGDYQSVFNSAPPLSDDEEIVVALPNAWHENIQKDYDAIMRGTIDRLNSAWCSQQLSSWGYTVEQLRALKPKARMVVCDKLVRAAKKTQNAKSDAVLEELLRKAPDKTAPGAYISPLDAKIGLRGGMPRQFFTDDTMRAARTDLHRRLCAWAVGPLVLEHPQGSSLHHLEDYDRECGGKWVKTIWDDRPHVFVVERDWARAFANYELTEGEAPLPFPHCCFEFRISGVRVLAMVYEGALFCVYGQGGHWVCDDYRYDFDTGRAHPIALDLNHVEFPRVAKLVRDNIRVACIMVDADLAHREVRQASPRLVQKRIAEKRPAPRDHYVIDLKKQRRYEGHPKSGGGSLGTKMRGHFRRGTWVHYEDVDSGQVQYADSGGFWHSRTWRPWHFAGDPNNLVEREYRL